MPAPSAPPARGPAPLAAAKPTRNLFDPWNSSSTGHQRAENRLSGSTSWRDSRSAKLAEQFADGQRGGRRMADTVGAGSEDFGADGRLENGAWEKGTKGLRIGGQTALWKRGDDIEREGGNDAQKRVEVAKPGKRNDLDGQELRLSKKLQDRGTDRKDEEGNPTPMPAHPQIFRNLTIYINGSTYPLVSDHKLKRLLVSHGARLSISLGRRTVTHVILGTPNGAAVGGAGGGLAGSKIQKEISATRGKGIKFVSAEWAMESIDAGKRLSEARFANVNIAPRGQKSVFGMLEVSKSKADWSGLDTGEHGPDYRAQMRLDTTLDCRKRLQKGEPQWDEE